MYLTPSTENFDKIQRTMIEQLPPMREVCCCCASYSDHLSLAVANSQSIYIQWESVEVQRKRLLFAEASEGFRKTDGSNVTDKVQNVGELMTNKFRTQAHHLKNVFAAPIDAVSPQYKPPVFEKSPEEQEFIKDALKHNFVFEGVSDKELDVIVAAHQPYDVDKNATIIKEGDKGDYFYVLRQGKVKFVKGDKQVGKGKDGASFGELALLYSAPRAASVVSTTPCKLYRLDQITFRSILQSHTQSEDMEKMELLRSVDFLQDLDPQDVHKLAAAMKPRSYQAGATILNKGDEGDVFYVIVSGKVRVTDITAGNAKYEDLELGKGRHFGERALITNEKRAATIFAVEPTKTLTIDKKTFVRVLGDYGSLVTAQTRQAQTGKQE